MRAVNCILALSCCLGMTADAFAAKFRMTESAKGEYTLTASAGRGFETTTLSVVCAPARNEYALILISPELGVPSRDEDVTLAASGRSFAVRRFDRTEESLMLLTDGAAGRGLVDSVSAASALQLEVAGRRIGFPLSAGAAEVAAFRRSCGFGPA